jgi:hypothetical protein
VAETFSIELPGGGAITALSYAAATGAAPLLVLAHGAGADQRHRFMVAAAEGLASRGVDVLTFDFPYTEAKRRRPDPREALEACWRAVLAWARPRARGPLFAGGKSMGGRIASQVAAEDASGVAGLVFLGYPLHPPGQPDKLRDEHLPRVAPPMLFVQGTRDPFGTPAELAPIVARCRAARVFTVEGADHSFEVLKRGGGPPREEVFRNILDEVARWLHAPT